MVATVCSVIVDLDWKLYYVISERLFVTLKLHGQNTPDRRQLAPACKTLYRAFEMCLA